MIQDPQSPMTILLVASLIVSPFAFIIAMNNLDALFGLWYWTQDFLAWLSELFWRVTHALTVLAVFGFVAFTVYVVFHNAPW